MYKQSCVYEKCGNHKRGNKISAASAVYRKCINHHVFIKQNKATVYDKV